MHPQCKRQCQVPQCRMLVSLCFKPSQPQGITSGLSQCRKANTVKWSKTHKRLKERFLIGRNGTKRANFPGSHFFKLRTTWKQEIKWLIPFILCQLDVGGWRKEKGTRLLNEWRELRSTVSLLPWSSHGSGTHNECPWCMIIGHRFPCWPSFIIISSIRLPTSSLRLCLQATNFFIWQCFHSVATRGCNRRVK